MSKRREAHEKIDKLRSDIMDLLKDEPDITWFLSIEDDKTGEAVHAGAGCPVCRVGRCIKWLVENNIQHDNLSDCVVMMILENEKETKH